MEKRRSFLGRDVCTGCGCCVDELTVVDEGKFLCDSCLDDYWQCSCCGEWYEICGYDEIKCDEEGNEICWFCAEEQEIGE